MVISLAGCRDLTESGRLGRYTSTLCFSFPLSDLLYNVDNMHLICAMDLIASMSRPAVVRNCQVGRHTPVDQFSRTTLVSRAAVELWTVLSSPTPSILAWMIRAAVGRQLCQASLFLALMSNTSCV